MLTYTLPLKTKSTTNQRGHWAKKARPAKTQREAAALAMPRFKLAPVLLVTLTRVAPRELDSDNLHAALKSVRDGVADAMGLKDDRNPLVVWDYAQERGEDAVRIAITRAAQPREEREGMVARELEGMLGALR